MELSYVERKNYRLSVLVSSSFFWASIFYAINFFVNIIYQCTCNVHFGNRTQFAYLAIVFFRCTETYRENIFVNDNEEQQEEEEKNDQGKHYK